jgi:hypothetical protein
MIANSIGRYLLQFGRPRGNQIHFNGWNSVREIAVVGLKNEDWNSDFWERFTQKIEAQGKLLTAVVFDPDFGRAQPASELNRNPAIHRFGRKDLDLFSKPKPKVLEPFSGRVFDVLICMAETPVLPVLFACNSVQSRFRVSCYEDSLSSCDLMLIRPAGMDLEVFIEQVFGYLAQINAA